ncbi:MAG: hypothetical protein WC523_04305 [Patescibacteria group bacterium]
MNDTRVRYSWNKKVELKKVEDNSDDGIVKFKKVIKRSPKNTLVTIRDNNSIYFGIARCKLSVSIMDKKEGKYGATTRAQSAKDSYSTVHEALYIDDSGLSGRVEIDNIVKLLEYFDNLDAIMVQKAQNAQKE